MKINESILHTAVEGMQKRKEQKKQKVKGLHLTEKFSMADVDTELLRYGLDMV